MALRHGLASMNRMFGVENRQELTAKEPSLAKSTNYRMESNNLCSNSNSLEHRKCSDYKSFELHSNYCGFLFGDFQGI